MNFRAIGMLLFALLLAGEGRASDSTSVDSSVAPAPRLRWSGYVQGRETLRPDVGFTATVNRARLALDVSVPTGWSARVSGEFAASAVGNTSNVQLRDAFVRGAKGPWSAQLGQSKTPMSREFLMSLSALEVPDRAAVIDTLASRRDIGLMLGYAPHRSLEVAAGVFNGEGQNVAANRDSTVLFVGRVAGRPVPGLELGASGATWEGDSTRVGLELAVDWRGAWGRSEYLAQEVKDRDGRDEGWYGLLGYRVKPSWAIVGRYEDLIRPALDAGRSRYRTTTLGLMWDAPNGHLRGLLDWVERAAGQERAITHTWIGQIQAKF